MTALMDELEKYLRRMRQQHELDAHQIQRVDEIITAQRESLLAKLRSLREHNAYGRAEIHREVLQLAAEVGLLPPPAPEPMNLSEPIALPRVYHTASEDLANAVNGKPLQ
jgi:hypothetical protein